MASSIPRSRRRRPRRLELSRVVGGLDAQVDRARPAGARCRRAPREQCTALRWRERLASASVRQKNTDSEHTLQCFTSGSALGCSSSHCSGHRTRNEIPQRRTVRTARIGASPCAECLSSTPVGCHARVSAAAAASRGRPAESAMRRPRSRGVPSASARRSPPPLRPRRLRRAHHRRTPRRAHFPHRRPPRSPSRSTQPTHHAPSRACSTPASSTRSRRSPPPIATRPSRTSSSSPIASSRCSSSRLTLRASPDNHLASPGRRLVAVREPSPTALGRAIAPTRPAIPLGVSDLLVNGRHDVSLSRDVKSELASADRVDLLCSFLKWSGFRLVEDDLRALLHRRPGSLRILTTAYMSATDRRALDELAALGATLKISYDTTRTRLHAKAWLFHRDSGFSTACIGSSNLSAAAMLDGLEWNVRLSQIDNAPILDKFRSTFEQYWDDPEFRAYDPEGSTAQSQCRRTTARAPSSSSTSSPAPTSANLGQHRFREGPWSPAQPRRRRDRHRQDDRRRARLHVSQRAPARSPTPKTSRICSHGPLREDPALRRAASVGRSEVRRSPCAHRQNRTTHAGRE